MFLMFILMPIAITYNGNERMQQWCNCSVFFPTDIHIAPNRWIQYFTCAENRHALPMFTSLLNTVCAYDPVGLGVPYNHLLFSDLVEPLVDTALQILIVTLDHDTSGSAPEGEEVCICTHYFCFTYRYFVISDLSAVWWCHWLCSIPFGPQVIKEQ